MVAHNYTLYHKKKKKKEKEENECVTNHVKLLCADDIF